MSGAAARARPERDDPDHQAIIDAVERLRSEISAVGARQEAQHSSLSNQLNIQILAGQNSDKRVSDVAKDLHSLAKIIGQETEDERGGTGMVGRMVRMETWQAREDQLKTVWVNRAIGFGIAAGVLLGVLWWVVQPSLSPIIQTRPAVIAPPKP